MPSFVILEKCDGCKALDKTACQYICPNDLMVLDKETMKAYNREPEMCWECYNCVKICPHAGHRRPRLRRLRAHGRVGRAAARSTDDIMWTVKFRNGMVKRFKFPIRTTPEGSAEPDGGYGEVTTDLDSQCSVHRARGPEAQRAAHTEEVILGRYKIWRISKL